MRTIAAGDLSALEKEIQLAKARFGLPREAPVRSCCEAGRNGLWLHRWLIARDVALGTLRSTPVACFGAAHSN